MEMLWNQKNLQKPPYRDWNVPSQSFDLPKFLSTVDKIVQDFDCFNLLNSEAALLSRLIYRMKRKFRSDKGLKNMEKVNRALLNYLNMDIQKDLENLRKFITNDNGNISLPPKQMLEYFLVRIQGFAKLMCRIETCAHSAAEILKARISIGQSWTTAMIAYAVISRIWTLSRHIVRRSCSWYQDIYKYSAIFKSIGAPWLPKHYSLPKNLTAWLDLHWIKDDVYKISTRKLCSNSIFNLIEANEASDQDIISQFIDKEVTIDQQICESINNSEFNENKIPDPKDSNQCQEVAMDSSNITVENSDQDSFIIKNEDFGEPIKRDSYQQSSQNKVKTKKRKSDADKSGIVKIKKLKFKRVASEKDVVKLLKASSYPGIKSTLWIDLQKDLKKLVIREMKKNSDKKLDETSFAKLNEHLCNWKNLNEYK